MNNLSEGGIQVSATTNITFTMFKYDISKSISKCKLKSAIEKGMKGPVRMIAKADQNLFLFPKQREEEATEHNQHKLPKG